MNGQPSIATVHSDFSSALSLLATDSAGYVGPSVPEILACAESKGEDTVGIMQNALVPPIHRLPTEILTRIFVKAWQNRKSMNLTHVCRRWRFLLLDTSEFWALAIAMDRFRLSTTDWDDKPDDDDYLAAACLRSAPRDISLHLSSISSGGFPLVQNSNRLISIKVSLETGEQLKWLGEAFDAGMPRLKDLSIYLQKPDQGPLTLGQLSAGTLPVLSRVTIPTALLGRFPLNTIRELSLRWDGKSHGQIVDPGKPGSLSINTLLRMLKYYPRLTSLDISDDTLYWRGQPQTDSPAFPVLRRLRIRSTAGPVSLILPRLTFPVTTHVDLNISDPNIRRGPLGQNAGSPRDQLFRIPSPLDAMVRRVDRVMLRPHVVPTLHGYIDGIDRIRITFVKSLQENIMDLFTRNRAPVTHVLMTEAEERKVGANTSALDPKLLAAFPHVTHGYFVLTPTATSFLKSLGRPQHPLPVDAMPPLSSLKELILGFTILRGGAISQELHGNDSAMCHALFWFRDWCKFLAEVLANRAARGHRLSRLDFYGHEDQCMLNLKHTLPVKHLHVASLDRDLRLKFESALKPIEELVDGPVVFRGYRFLACE